MEDVVAVYHRPPDEGRPVACVAEAPVRLAEQVRTPVPAEPGRPRRCGDEYRRDGTANPFLAFAPRPGWRAARVTERRTRADFAAFPRWVVEDGLPRAKRAVPVAGNLNAHTPGSRYEAFLPPAARRPPGRPEWHGTPEHGSWPNVAECEPSAPSRQCPPRRIESAGGPRRQVEAWVDDRNEREVGARWRLTTTDARIRLRSLYPTLR